MRSAFRKRDTFSVQSWNRKWHKASSQTRTNSWKMPSSPAVNAQQEVRARRLASTTGLFASAMRAPMAVVCWTRRAAAAAAIALAVALAAGGWHRARRMTPTVGLVRAERVHYEEALGVVAAVGLVDVLALFYGGGGPRLGAVLEGIENPQHGSQVKLMSGLGDLVTGSTKFFHLSAARGSSSCFRNGPLGPFSSCLAEENGSKSGSSMVP
jgi:hypothetical protein